MPRSLAFLLGLLLWGRLRRWARGLRTVKGALLSLVGGLIFVPWLVAVLLGAGREVATPAHLADVRRLGPLLLFAFCLLNFLQSSTERAVYFAPAEVNFLFSGPYSPRQLLAYRLASFLMAIVPSALLLSVVFSAHAAWWPAALVGMLLMLSFIQLFSMAVSLTISTIGELAFSRVRRLVLAGIAAVVVGGLLVAGGPWRGRPRGQLLGRIEQSPGVRAALTPFRWFLQAFTAERPWPDLAQASALGLGVIAALVVLIFALNAQYLETSAAVSARIYARIERLRRGGTGAGPTARRAGRSVRGRVPGLPWWGGAGPIAWRQLTAAVRSFGRILTFVLILGLMMTVNLLGGRHAPADPERVDQQLIVLAGLLVGTSFFLSPMVSFDFRGDVDRIEVLKTLPIHPAAMVVGQLAVPVLVVTLLQWLGLAAVVFLTGTLPSGLVAGVALVVPAVNLLVLGIDNLLFLLFPARVAATSPGDIQAMGRQVLLMLAKIVSLTLAIGLGLLLGLAGYSLSGGSAIAALASIWATLVAFGMGTIPLVALAFRRFDVARDTPV